MTRRLPLAPTLALGLSLGLAACSGQVTTTQNDPGGQASGAPSGGSDAMIETLTLPAEVADNVAGVENYNMFSPAATSRSYFLEPMMIRSSVNCEVVPWLATDYSWDGPSKISFTLREGITWSDGEPLTAEDVVFTLMLGKQYPAADGIGLFDETWGAPATSVTADGNTVHVEFAGNAAAKFESLISARIMPKHIWEKVGDPTKYVEKKPVGTGPFQVKSYNGRKLVLEKREDYWQADKVKVKNLVLEGNYDATNAALKLSAGQLDAYWGEIPNPEKAFVAKNPALNHFWYAPAGSTVLTPNTSKAPFDDAAFRNAYSLGLNKEEMSAKATYGVMKPASQTGLKLPYAENLLPDDLKGQDTVLKFDTAAAEKALDEAGYKVGSDGFRTKKDGSKLDIEFSVQAGWIDYQAAADVIVNNLKAMKLNAKVVTSPPDAVDLKKKQGEFDMMLEYLNGGCEVARNLGSKLASNQIPTKTTVEANVQRWNDPATDEIVKKLSGASDPAEQKKYVGELVDVMMTKTPVTPLFYAPARMIYRTDKAVGWPSEADPYGTNGEPLLIMTRLRSAR